MSPIDPAETPATERVDKPASGTAPPSRQSWRKELIASLLIVLVTVIILRAMGRSWWCQCATPHLFVFGVWSEHNSQHLLDPYVFSHLQHGLVLYALFAILASQWTRWTRAVIVIAIECSWEVVENTSWIIGKYRDSTVSLEYYGDSIVNSVADIGACMLGYVIAATVPVIVSAAGFLTIELVMLLLIRDSLLLNIIMLVHPFEAIKQWQLGGVASLLCLRKSRPSRQATRPMCHELKIVDYSADSGW